MGLKGNIKEFNIADIFQLLSLQQKSGALNIRSSEGNMLFLFKEGEIVDVSPDLRSRDQLIGQMLVDGGIITDIERERSLKEQDKRGAKLGELLAEKGLVDKDTLSRFLTIQIKECFFRALTYQDGSYIFDSYTIQSYPSLKEPVKVEYLLMEGMQFLDEFPLIKKKFPAEDILVKTKRKLSSKDLGKDMVAKALHGSMKDFMEPIKHIRRANLTLFEGYKALARLNELDALSIREKEKEKAKEDQAESRASAYRRIKAHSVVNILFLLVFTGGIMVLICDIIKNSGIMMIMKEILKGF